MVRMLDIGWTEKWEAGFRVKCVWVAASERTAWVCQTTTCHREPRFVRQEKQPTRL